MDRNRGVDWGGGGGREGEGMGEEGGESAVEIENK